MAFEVEVPVRHRTMWLAFTDPEKMARAVPGLTVDAVHPVPPADGPEGVAGDVVAGRLKLRVGAAGGTGASITYRGTACIAGAEAHKGTLDIAIDAAQARGNGALAGYLRVTLAAAGDAGERTLVSVVPELELSGRALEFERRDWHGAVEALGAAWVEALAAQFRTVDEDAATEPSAEEATESAASSSEAATDPSAPSPEAATDPSAPSSEIAKESPESDSESDSEKITNPPVPTVAADTADAFSEDPLAAVWNGRYEKNRWLPLIMALALFLLIKRRRRHRADHQGADSSFRME